MISPALMLSWMWGKKRQPIPEYQSPNTWYDYVSKNSKALGVLDELTETFNPKQIELYEKYRESVLEANRAKPWQNITNDPTNPCYILN